MPSSSSAEPSRQATQRPPDDAGAAAAPGQPDVDAADPADGVGVHGEPGSCPGWPVGRRPRYSATVMAMVEYGISMRWLTFRDDSGQRTGVLSGDEDPSAAAGRELARADRARCGRPGRGGGGRAALGATVPLDQVTLMAPIPRPPSIRDSLCFLDHMRNCQAAMGGGRVLKDTWYRIPAFYFACPTTVLGPYDDAPMAPGSVWQDFELEVAAVIGTAGTRPVGRRSRTGDRRIHDLQRLVGARLAATGRSTGDRPGQGQGQRRHTGPVPGHAGRTRAVPP